MDINTLLELLSTLLDNLDSWGSPSDVFTALGGFLGGTFMLPIGLAISRAIEKRLGRDVCRWTGASLNKKGCPDGDKCSEHGEKKESTKKANKEVKKKEATESI